MVRNEKGKLIEKLEKVLSGTIAYDDSWVSYKDEVEQVVNEALREYPSDSSDIPYPTCVGEDAGILAERLDEIRRWRLKWMGKREQ